MIRARGLSKTFRRRKDVIEAVSGVDIDVAEGELVAFLGPNGAGKSTTLRMLTGLLAPTSGTATVAGHDVASAPEQVRANLGYIGQGTGGGHSHRVLDEMHNQGRFYGLRAAEYRARSRELLEALELRGLEKRTVQSLSGGQKRRLDVAMGLVNHPPLLFLDEPSTGLDPHSRANLWEHIGEMRRKYGMTLVLTTHYLDEADSMAERVIVIDHGNVIADASPEALKREYADDVVTMALAPDGDPDDLAAAAERALGTDLGAVTTNGRPDGTGEVEIVTSHGPDRLPAAVERLSRSGVGVASARVRMASLDDVFLNLTGRSLRENSV